MFVVDRELGQQGEDGGVVIDVEVETDDMDPHDSQMITQEISEDEADDVGHGTFTKSLIRSLNHIDTGHGTVAKSYSCFLLVFGPVLVFLRIFRSFLVLLCFYAANVATTIKLLQISAWTTDYFS